MKQAFVYTMNEICMLVLDDLLKQGKIAPAVSYNTNVKTAVDVSKNTITEITFTVEELGGAPGAKA